MSQESGKKGFDRRGFLRASAGVVAAPAIPVGALVEVASVANSALTPAVADIFKRLGNKQSGGLQGLFDLLYKLKETSYSLLREGEATLKTLPNQEIEKRGRIVNRFCSFLSEIDKLIQNIGDVSVLSLKDVIKSKIHGITDIFSNTDDLVESFDFLQSEYGFTDSDNLSTIYRLVVGEVYKEISKNLLIFRDFIVEDFGKRVYLNEVGDPAQLSHRDFARWVRCVSSDISKVGFLEMDYIKLISIEIEQLKNFLSKMSLYDSSDKESVAVLTLYIEESEDYLSRFSIDHNNGDGQAFHNLTEKADSLWRAIEDKDYHDEGSVPEFMEKDSVKSSYIRGSVAPLGGIMLTEHGFTMDGQEKNRFISRVREFIRDRIKITNEKLKKDSKSILVITEDDYNVLAEHGSIVIIFRNPFMNDVDFGNFNRLKLPPTRKEVEQQKQIIEKENNNLEAELRSVLSELYKIAQRYYRQAVIDKIKKL